jgi:hypothetical protein
MGCLRLPASDHVRFTSWKTETSHIPVMSKGKPSIVPKVLDIDMSGSLRTHYAPASRDRCHNGPGIHNHDGRQWAGQSGPSIVPKVLDIDIMSSTMSLFVCVSGSDIAAGLTSSGLVNPAAISLPETQTNNDIVDDMMSISNTFGTVYIVEIGN